MLEVVSSLLVGGPVIELGFHVVPEDGRSGLPIHGVQLTQGLNRYPEADAAADNRRRVVG